MLDEGAGKKAIKFRPAPASCIPHPFIVYATLFWMLAYSSHASPPAGME